MVQGRVASPLRIPRNKKGDLWSLNLNNLNNTHFQSYNNLKKRYTQIMMPQIEKLPVFEGAVRVTCTIYAENKRLFDVDNVGCVHAKMFLDALVQSGRLEEDNYLYVPDIRYIFGEVDRENPRCDILIQEI